jgi:hypothetical protein
VASASFVELLVVGAGAAHWAEAGQAQVALSVPARRSAATIVIRGRRAARSGSGAPAGRRSRPIAAEQAAAHRVGTDDLHRWLRERHAAGCH